ncbi:hypothetical protein ACIBG8_54245 [Nonomuraea sp. NPDC050556]|uniref:hypothetical protein n=1 Tax=Nonomuraea sp. NPDC050556 TaxID=3364369 RepID=UPI00379024F9
MGIVADKKLPLLVATMYKCLCDTFAASSRPVCRCFVYHGAARPPVENCTPCGTADPAHDPPQDAPNGQAWVRVTRVIPVIDPVAANCCVNRYQAVLEIGVQRCLRAVSQQGEAPSIEDLTADAFDAYADWELLRSSVQDCFVGDSCEAPLNWVSFGEPVGPAGGYSGWAFQFQVELST